MEVLSGQARYALFLYKIWRFLAGKGLALILLCTAFVDLYQFTYVINLWAPGWCVLSPLRRLDSLLGCLCPRLYSCSLGLGDVSSLTLQAQVSDTPGYNSWPQVSALCQPLFSWRTRISSMINSLRCRSVLGLRMRISPSGWHQFSIWSPSFTAAAPTI